MQQTCFHARPLKGKVKDRVSLSGGRSIRLLGTKTPQDLNKEPDFKQFGLPPLTDTDAGL